MKRHVHSVAPDMTVAEAARIMKSERIGFLPVCDQAHHPLGVVTDRDLAIRVCAANLPSATTTVSQVMTLEPVSCTAELSVDDVEKLMARKKTRRVLAVDGQNRLVGLITFSDMAHHQDPFKAARMLRDLSTNRFRLEK